MKRSPGVTSAAVVAVLGSICVAIIGLLVFIGLRLQSMQGHQSGRPPAQFPFSPITVLTFSISSGALGLATAIGLLRLQDWARITILIFSSVVAVLTILFLPLFWFLSPQGKPGGVMVSSSAFHLTLNIFLGVPLGIAIWWLVFFSRRSIGTQFLGMRLATERPTGITIIAWLSIIFCLLDLLIILRTKSAWTVPEPFFLVIFTGVTAKIYRRLFLPFSVLASAGILWNRVWGFWMEVALEVYYLLSRGVFFAFPNNRERWQAFLKIVVASRPPEKFPGFYRVFLIWLFAFSMVEVALFLSILLIGKKRYFAVASRRQSQMSATS